jgi:hypothetical protein
MIKSLEVILPIDFPYRLVSFKFFFENYNTHTMNLYHAAGMNLIYEQTKMCYLFPQNEFYQLLELENTDEPHDEKYNWILMKGTYDNEPKIAADIKIENKEMLDNSQPGIHFDRQRFNLHRLPEPEDDIAISDQGESALFHHFSCREVLLTEGYYPLIGMIYLQSYYNPAEIINRWLDEKDKLKSW